MQSQLPRKSKNTKAKIFATSLIAALALLLAGDAVSAHQGRNQGSDNHGRNRGPGNENQANLQGSGGGGGGGSVVATNLKALWHMEELIPFTLLTPDDSGNGNHGTLNGGMGFVPGKFDLGLGFDGVDDYVSVSHNGTLDMTGAYTLEAWLKVDDLSTYRPVLVRGTTDANDIEVYIQAVSHDLIVAHNRGNGGTFDFVGFVDPPVGSFFHLAVTYGAGTVTAYYNGEPKLVTQMDTAVTAPLDTDKPWQIGRVSHSAFDGLGCPTGPVRCFFDGTMDETRIWSRTLSPVEVKVSADQGLQTAADSDARAPKQIDERPSLALDVFTRRWDIRGVGSTNPIKVNFDIVTSESGTTVTPAPAGFKITRAENVFGGAAGVTKTNIDFDGDVIPDSKGVQLSIPRSNLAQRARVEFEATLSDGQKLRGRVDIRP